MAASYHHGVEVVEMLNGTRPIRTVNSAVIGVVGTAPGADDNVFPLNEPVLIIGSRTKAAKLGSTGTLPLAMDAIFDQIAPLIVVVRVAEIENDNAQQQANIIGEVSTTGQFTGLKALLAAKSKLGVKPRIIGAPGFSHVQTIADELGNIAEELRGFAYADIEANTAEDAVVYRNQFGNKRLMLMWPAFKVFDVSSAQYVVQPASARALGLRAKLDNDIGWHKTISNIPLNGVSGLTADIDWDLQNPNTKAVYLNENEVTTMIVQDGYRFWGSRTCSGDSKFAFESAVRTSDILADTIGDAHMWAIDKPMSQTLITDIIDGVNAKFRELKAKGYIVNAECYLDPELNEKESLEAGKLWLNYDYTPVPPLEHLTFETLLTNKYLVELLPGAKAA